MLLRSCSLLSYIWKFSSKTDVAALVTLSHQSDIGAKDRIAAWQLSQIVCPFSWFRNMWFSTFSCRTYRTWRTSLRNFSLLSFPVCSFHLERPPSDHHKEVDIESCWCSQAPVHVSSQDLYYAFTTLFKPQNINKSRYIYSSRRCIILHDKNAQHDKTRTNSYQVI